MTSFKKAVETFKKSAADWLSDEDLPAVVVLEQTAEQLDTKITPALVAQFGLTYRNLLKRKPGDATDGGDELDDLIPDS